MPKFELDAAQPIVISLGGSMVVPNGGPNVDFLRIFDALIRKEVAAGRRFIVVVGGGKTARHYIDAASKLNNLDPEDLDWIGIHATRLNGHLLRTMWRDIAHPVVMKNPEATPAQWKGQVLVAAGWKPGRSTDFTASRMAEIVGTGGVVNLSNVAYVYEEDPRKNPDAKPLEQLDWSTYLKMVGEEWSPGKSAPFDPVASKFCLENNLKVAIVNGEDLGELERLLSTGEFNGTVLE